MNNGFMIKYGKKQHLQQIVDGVIRFAPSQDYVKLEKQQHNKGQGDLLEGKWVIHAERMTMEDLDNNQVIEIPQKTKIVLGAVDVNDMPMFCISQYGSEYIIKTESDERICLTKDKLECIRRDFPDATHALIILEQQKFIDSIKNIKGHIVVSDSIHYYNYDINDIRMASFLTTGDELSYKIGKVVMSMTYDERYRHLMCKDKYFIEQNEYRFIVTDELSDVPIFYNFSFESKYVLLPISELEDTIIIA